MKKRFYYIAVAVLALGLASCTKVATTPEQPATPEVPGQMTIVANIGDDASTKTTLSGDDQSGYDILWSEGDEIRFYFKNGDNYEFRTYTLTEGAGTKYGKFTGPAVPAGIEYTARACYGDNLTTTGLYSRLEIEQHYSEVPNASFSPMMANIEITDGVATLSDFKNIGGLLRLSLKGSGTVKEIKVTTDQSITGPFALDEDGAAVMVNFSQNKKYTILNCGEGVELSSTEKPFFISLPKGNYAGVKIEVSDFAGRTFTKTLKADKSLNIERAQITPATLTVTGLLSLLTKDSPVGAIGGIDGREGMVVDLGGTIGKVVIATRNVDSSTPTKEASSAKAAGSYLNFSDAKTAMGTSGWYVPSKAEWEALINIHNSHVGSCQKWVIGTGDNQHELYFNWAGKYDLYGDKGEGFYYWSGTEVPSSPTKVYIFYGITYNNTLIVTTWNKDNRLQVRPFHKLD